MAHDVFISYSSIDKAIADGICANLEAAGVRCWIAPRDIAPGADWPTMISMAIPQSRAMVLVFSTSSNNSDDVNRELILAAKNKVIIIPFKIDDVAPKPGMEYYLARTHWLDAMNPPTREQIQKLVETVKKLLSPEKPAETPVIQAAPAAMEKAAQSPKAKGIKPWMLWSGLSILVVLAVVLCIGGAVLGKQFFATQLNSLIPTQTASGPSINSEWTATAPVLLPAWTSTAPVPTPTFPTSDAAGPTLAMPTAGAPVKLFATLGTILDVPGRHVAWSADGKWLVIGESQIHFYDAQSLKETRSIQENLAVFGMAISPDSQVLAAIDQARGVILFDMGTGSELRTLPRTKIGSGGVSSYFLAFSPDSSTLAVVIDDTVKLFKVADGQETGTLVAKGTNAILFAPDGRSLYAGSWSGISVWDVATSAQTRTVGDPSANMTITRMALSPDGNVLVTGGPLDNPMVVWEASTGRQLRSLAGHKDGITSLVFSPDGKLLASAAGDVTIKLWEVGTGNLLQTLTGHTEAVSSLTFSPDGNTLVSGSVDGTTRLWNLSEGTPGPTATPVDSPAISRPTALPLSANAVTVGNAAQVKNLKILDVPGRHVAWSADGKWLVIGGGQIYFYDAQSLKEVRSIQGNLAVFGMAISPDSQLLAVIDSARGVILFDMSTGSELRTLPRTKIGTGAVSSYFLAFSPDSSTLAVVLGDTVKLFKVADGQEMGTLVTKGVNAIGFAPDGGSLYAGSWSGISVWDVASSAQTRTVGDPSMNTATSTTRMALSPDGSMLVTGGSFDHPMVVWEASSGRQLRSLAGHKDGITSLVFSPDGKLLASAAGDVTIKLWDVGAGTLLQTLTGHTEAVTSLAFSPDGATLASTGSDQGVWLWGVGGK